jgi:hypothetical protein
MGYYSESPRGLDWIGLGQLYFGVFDAELRCKNEK